MVRLEGKVGEKMGKVKLHRKLVVGDVKSPKENPEAALARAMAEVRDDRHDSHVEALHLIR